jgi:glycine dehydrogenase subunit 1
MCHTELERKEMLAAIGLASMADLFLNVPERVRFPDLKLRRRRRNSTLPVRCAHLLRAILLIRHTRSLVPAPTTISACNSRLCALRGEFYTSYTQYQPEVSQGMLQAMFECRA